MPKVSSVGNPIKAYDKLRAKNRIKNNTKHRNKPGKFSHNLREIGDAFIKTKQRTALNNRYSAFAESLAAKGLDSIAGIIYSFLIRINKGINTELTEGFLHNALAIAKRLHDPVHVMARAKDLKEIYKLKEYGSARHLSMLNIMRKSLNSICRNYESVRSRHVTVKTEMKPVEHYKLLLAETKIEIAELLKTSKPKEAALEIKEANEILVELRNSEYRLRRLKTYDEFC